MLVELSKKTNENTIFGVNGKDVISLAWPAILEYFLVTLIQFVNTGMVSSMGTYATAAVAINSPPINFINGIFTAIGVGSTALVARYYGTGETEKANDVARQSLIMGLVLGSTLTIFILFFGQFIPKWMGAEEAVLAEATLYLKIISISFAFFYTSIIMMGVLRGASDTRTPMKINIIVNILNIIGNMFLIYPSRSFGIGGITIPGAGLGVKGAALSTCISQSLCGMIMIAMLFSCKLKIKLGFRKSFIPDIAIIKRILFIGIPTAIERIVINSGQMIFMSLIAGLGSVFLTVQYLTFTIESISYMPVLGFSIAATTLVGQMLGAKDAHKAERYGNICFVYGSVFVTLMGILLFFFPQPLLKLFTSDPEVIMYGCVALRYLAVTQPFLASTIIYSGALRGAGDTRWPMYIAMICMWGLRLSVAWILIKIFKLGLNGAWIGMVIDLFIRGIMVFLRFRKGEWKYIRI